MIRLFLFLIVLFLVDVYAFQAFRFTARTMPVVNGRILYGVYAAVSLFCFAVILAANLTDWHLWSKLFRTYSFAIVFIVFFSKLFLCLFLLADDAGRLVRWCYAFFQSKVSHRNDSGSPGSGIMISRSEFMVKAGMVIGAVPFVSLIFGMINGAYNYRIRRVKLRFAGLPSVFNKLRIVQLSDLHLGSFHSKDPVLKIVKMVNELKPDVVFFTGDLVNDRHTEALPYIKELQKIQTPLGVYSVFGNHDYGDYARWNSEDEKLHNREALKNIHRELGWNLLWDEHAHIERDGERISVIGVQNWSGRAGFQRYGNLQKATRGIEYSGFNILLSHDPSHWDAEVNREYPLIHLTLSGHTHGMQFGVEIPGFKWSPAQYFYKEWAGLYQTASQYLYVNRGLGFIGYPGRVGILPEITLFEIENT